jgi:hypothetical protein
VIKLFIIPNSVGLAWNGTILSVSSVREITQIKNVKSVSESSRKLAYGHVTINPR